MIWPLIPYSYDTACPRSAGAGADAARRQALARHRRPGPRRAGARHLRLSHLGPVRPDADPSSAPSSASSPARCRAISAARSISSSSASSRSSASMPTLFLLMILASAGHAQFLVAAGHHAVFTTWTWPVGLVRAEFLRARNFEYVRAARALGIAEWGDHVPPHPAQRHGLDHDLHAVSS